LLLENSGEEVYSWTLKIISSDEDWFP